MQYTGRQGDGRTMVQKTLNAAGMKERNRRKIIEYLRMEALSRAELSRRTGLTRAGISVIVDELIADGILVEGRPIVGKVGRVSIELKLNPEYGYVVGIDLARDYCSVGCGDFMGNVSFVHKLEGHGEPARDIMEKLLSRIIRVKKRMEEGGGKFLGIGITAPGPLDLMHGRILNPPNFDKWKYVEIADYFREKCGCPVYLENNAKAYALAEKYFGVGNRYRNYIELLVDTGIGGGIVFDGKLYQGSSFLGGDFGHMCVDIHGERCGCGNYGCAEMYASIPNIEKYSMETTGEKLGWNQIVDRACGGDAKMRETVDREARYLAAVITNATNIMDMDAVVMASAINYRSDYLLPLIQEYVNRQFIGRELKKIEIVASSMEKNNRVLPGVNLVLENGI